MPPALLMILFVSSCVSSRPKFDPDAYRANHLIMGLVNEDEIVVYAEDPAFSDFACMRRSKWEELRKFVQLLRLPSEQKNILMKNFDFVNERQIKN